MKCHWCGSDHAQEARRTGYWELPDGSRAVEIKEIPSVSCRDCGIEYQEDTMIEKIEDQLMLIDTKKLSSPVTYDDLMAVPRLLKKNYFKL
ncbi:YokU family protein [Fictibacillus iocasae]|uniref:YokU family protein n=1 Tax=Fictibacillus iocasae TaxID=2715437 RepID=A0ABW2NNJ3_9BACL